MENKNGLRRLIEAIVKWFSDLFGSSRQRSRFDMSCIESVELPKDFKETVELSDVVAYFKGLIGKIKQGEDTPFVALASGLVLKIDKPESTLVLATYNEKSETVENVLLLEFNSLGETLKSALSKSENGIVTLS